MTTMAEIKIEQAEDSYFKAIISASLAEVNAYEKKSLDVLRAKKQLPGFRKGKAPDSLLKAKFADEVKTKKLNLFLDSQISAIDQKSEFGIYSIDKFDKLEEKNDQFIFEILFSANPHVSLGKLKDFGLIEDIPIIEDSDIDDALKNLLRQYANYESIEGPAVYGSLIEAEYEVLVDDIPHGELETRKFFLGDNHVNENLEKEMIEKAGKVGEEFSYKIVRKMPDTSTNKEVDKTIQFIFTIKNISKAHLPELNDEFVAQNFPHIETVEKYRETLKQWFEKDFHHVMHKKELNKAFEKLTHSSSFYIPEILMKSEMEEYLKPYKISYEDADKETIKYVRSLVESQQKGNLLFHKLLSMAEEKQKEKNENYNYKDAFFNFIDKENDAMSAQDIKSIYNKIIEQEKFEIDEKKEMMDEQLENFHLYLLFEFFRDLGLIQKGKPRSYKEFVDEDAQ